MSLPDNYVGLSPLYCGRDAPGDPAWMATAGVALNKAVAMPGAAGHGGASVHVWGSYAIDLVRNRMYCVACGGHGVADNRAVWLDLQADTLIWQLSKASTGNNDPANLNVPWLIDSTGMSTHTYDYMHWIPSIGRVIKHFLRGLNDAGGDAAVVQGFNPDATPPAWDPINTYTYGNNAGYSPAVDHVHSKILTSGLKLYDPLMNSYTTPITGSATFRYPVAYNANDDYFFSLMWGGGEGEDYLVNNPGLNAFKIPSAGAVQEITFNASAAYTQFVSERPKPPENVQACGYSGMCHDTANNKFYWYSGYAGREGNLYVITPNAGTAWDMSLFNWAVAPTLPTAPGAGVNGRVKYFPLLKGFVICPDGTNLYFVKTSN